MLFAILIFNLVRGAYFVILSQGITGAVVEYTLVVLPTFFYFTAFTLIIGYWAVTCVRQLQILMNPQLFHRYVKIVIGGINVGLYSIFILFILLYNFLVANTQSSQCGARVAADLSTVNQNQKYISYAYAILLPVLSFVAAVGFMYYGTKLTLKLAKSRKSKNVGKRQVTLIAVIFALSFILHCIFILIVVGLNTANVYFSFVGLVITEALPSVFVLSLYKRIKRKKTHSSSETTGTNKGSFRQSIESVDIDLPKMADRLDSINERSTSLELSTDEHST